MKIKAVFKMYFTWQQKEQKTNNNWYSWLCGMEGKIRNGNNTIWNNRCLKCNLICNTNIFSAEHERINNMCYHFNRAHHHSLNIVEGAINIVYLCLMHNKSACLHSYLKYYLQDIIGKATLDTIYVPAK